MSKRRIKKSYSKEFKAEAVRLVLETGKTKAEIARDLGISHTALREWVRQHKVDESSDGTGALTTEERKELQRLRKENRVLQMERDILKKATAFFAKESR